MTSRDRSTGFFQSLGSLFRWVIIIGLIGVPIVALGDEPAPPPAPVESPAPSPDPSPAAEPSPAPDPSPSPSPAVDPAPADPSPSTDPAPADPSPAADPAPAAAPTITSDQPDYPPGANVILTGANWQPGESVHIRVNDDQGMTWRRDVDVVADANGSIRDEFQLPDWFVALYTVTATGTVSGVVSTTFTDADVKAATLSIRTSLNTTTCSSTTTATFTSGDRACARSTITDVTGGAGATGNIFVLWVDPGGTIVQTNTHNGAIGASFDDTSVVSTTGDWIVRVCSNNPCNTNQELARQTFKVNAANVAPTISLPGPALTYTENAAATIIDAGATATDPDSANFDTGTLTIDYSVGGSADDRLAIRNEGTGAGQIGVSGSNVTFGGTTIGTFTGGTGTTALVVTFNANSSPAAAQALMRNITYANVSDSPAASRTVRFVLTDGDGGTSNAATKVINVTAVNDAPVVDLNGGAAGIDYTTTFTEDGPAVAAVDAAALTVTDADNANIASATITLTNHPDGADESLSVTGVSCPGITVAAYNSSTGVLALTGSTTKAAYQACLRTLTYNNADQDPNTSDRSVTVKVNDGSLDSATATSTIHVTAVNDAPTLDLNGAAGGVDATATFTEDGPPTALAPAAVVDDVDDTNLIAASVQLTINPPSGTVVPDVPDEILWWDGTSGGACDGLSLSYSTATGTLIVTGTATVGRYQACLRSIKYQNTRDAMNVTARNAEFTVFDAHAVNNTSNRPDVTITLVPVNDAPVANDFSVSADEDGSTTVDLAGHVSDAETSDADLTYTIVSGPAHGSLTGTGGSRTYTPNGDFNGSDSVTYKVTDRGDPDNCSPISTTCDSSEDSAIKTVSITVTAVNDAPVNTVPDPQTTDEDTAKTFSSIDGNAITVADVDVLETGGGKLKVTLSVTDGTLTLGSPSSVDFSCGTCVGDGTDDATMTFLGAPAAINTALNGLSYSPTADFNVSSTLTITTNDQGNTGSGGAKSDTDTVSITVNAVNDAPVNTVPGTQTTDEDTALEFSTAGGNAISVADVDIAETPTGKFEVTLSVTHGALTLGTTAGLVFSTGDGNADASMVFTGSPAAVNAALEGLTYVPTLNYNGPASLSLTADDQGNTGSGGALTDTDSVAITVVPVNDTPTAEDFSASTNEDTAATIDFTGHVADVETSDANLTYTIVSGPSHGTISSGTGGSRTYTPAANYNGPDSLTYKVTDRGDPDDCGAPGPSCDAAEISSIQTVSITVVPVNDTPTADAVTMSTPEDTAKTIGLSGSDVETCDLSFSIVSGPAHGSLGSIANLACASGSPKTDSANVIYTPTTNYNGPDSFTYKVRDTGDVAGCSPGPGCSAALDSVTKTVSITVTAVNDDPVIDETSTSFTSNTVGCPAGAPNATLTVRYSDPDIADSTPDTQTVTINWGDGSSSTVPNASSPVARTHSYASAGMYTATVTVTDHAGAVDSTTRLITVNFNVVGGAFKQPVNDTRNGHDLPSIFKYGSTIPLKLEVTDCNGSHPGTLDIRIYWQKLSGGVPQGEVEAVSTSAADTGNHMRFTDPNYMFNWNTKLVNDQTSTIRIQAEIVSTGQIIYSDIGLKK